MKEKILALKLTRGQSVLLPKDAGTQLVVSYSEKRATKDAYDSEGGIKKLEQQLKSGKLTKTSINNRGYNKFLNIEDEVKISLDKEKMAEDAKWDGLKGYLTNTALNKDEIIANYKHFWQIEKAFRIAKTDLKVRPVYHRVQRKIEAHTCIAFAAYKVYKELEIQLQEKQANLSPEKAIDIAKTIFAIKVRHPISSETFVKTLLLTDEHHKLAKLFDC